MSYDDGYCCDACGAWYGVPPNEPARANRTWVCNCPRAGRVRPVRRTAYENWLEREVSRLEAVVLQARKEVA